ncbi:hypothetical protein DPV78_012168 [Talaromyces pinophilus]|nr:hypothetical protein DPV78_012168 [Talaromyces pinophilus]
MKLDDVVLELSTVDVPPSGLALIILSKTRDPLRLPSEEEGEFLPPSTSQVCALLQRPQQSTTLDTTHLQTSAEPSLTTPSLFTGNDVSSMKAPSLNRQILSSNCWLRGILVSGQTKSERLATAQPVHQELKN